MRRNDITLLENFQAFFRESVAIHVAGRNFVKAAPFAEACSAESRFSETLRLVPVQLGV
jgi:hypothetical protein